MNTYIVREGNTMTTPIVLKGRSSDVCQLLDVSWHQLYRAIKLKRPLKGHMVYLTEEKLPTKREEENQKRLAMKEKKVNKKEQAYIDAKKMIDIHHNTIIYKYVDLIVPRLESEGYVIKVKHEPRREIKYRDSKKKDIYSECWILEGRKVNDRNTNG